jgi:hypothetical protein
MTKTEILNSLKQLSNIERLEIIEFASYLMREEITEQSQTEHITINDDNTALNPTSAEAKALMRLNSSCEEEEWIIVDNIGQEIDLDQVKEQFYKSGYKSKVSTQKTSSH